MEDALANFAPTDGSFRLRIINNPFYTVADNISSCWLARGEMTGDFMLLNGDTLFQAPLVARLLDSPTAPVTLAVDHKAALRPGRYEGLPGRHQAHRYRQDPAARTRWMPRSIGVMVFRGEGPKIFARYLDETLRDSAALKLYYLSVIRRMAMEGVEVRTASIKGHPWCEIDYPLDLKAGPADGRLLVRFGCGRGRLRQDGLVHVQGW